MNELSLSRYDHVAAHTPRDESIAVETNRKKLLQTSVRMFCDGTLSLVGDHRDASGITTGWSPALYCLHLGENWIYSLPLYHEKNHH
jgi:hypothetical protein